VYGSPRLHQVLRQAGHRISRKRVIRLMHLDGLSYQEMAEVVGISENYIGVKLSRIRKQLADHLKGAADEL